MKYLLIALFHSLLSAQVYYIVASGAALATMMSIEAQFQKNKCADAHSYYLRFKVDEDPFIFKNRYRLSYSGDKCLPSHYFEDQVFDFSKSKNILKKIEPVVLMATKNELRWKVKENVLEQNTITGFGNSVDIKKYLHTLVVDLIIKQESKRA